MSALSSSSESVGCDVGLCHTQYWFLRNSGWLGLACLAPSHSTMPRFSDGVDAVSESTADCAGKTPPSLSEGGREPTLDEVLKKSPNVVNGESDM